MSLEADIRSLLVEVIRTEVVPSLREELRAIMTMLSPPSQPSQVLTVAEAARTLKVASSTIHEWIRTGTLAAFKLPGGREYRIQREQLEKLMHAGAETTRTVDSDDEAARILSAARGRTRRTGGD